MPHYLGNLPTNNTDSTNMYSIWRMVDVIRFATAHLGQFDPPWYAPTPTGLASLEGHLAATCAALPVFWPVLKTKWNRIFVTRKVSVTREYGVFPSKAAQDVEMQSMSSDRNLTLDPQSQEPEGWEPFVGDETTGLGENETVVQSPAVLPGPKQSGLLRFKQVWSRRK